MVASECLDDATVARLVADEVSADERLEILAHADGCEDCRELLVAVAGGSAGDADEGMDDRTLLGDDETMLATRAEGRTRGRASPRPGDSIDHYTVVEVLGHGGMGVVVHARDSELGRDVALKLLIHAGSDNAERRLVREAQAMAQLSHRNVVTVHAVGRYDDGVYIAMELVRGTTLGRWVAQRSRPWNEILRVYVEAAEGLAAAHGAGLVHRDFKPDNVLVGHDGRVLVTDFGLAGVAHSFTGSHSQQSEALELSTSLTQTGVVMGTPRFMAPEQYRGSRQLDARADQFAFGVALYHALYDRYPFEGDNVEALRMSVSEGVPVTPPPQVQVPRAVWVTLQRCIEREPQARYPSMRAVIRDLRAVLDAPARRRRTLVAAVLGSSLLVGGVALGLGLDDEEPPRPCAQLGDRLAGVWDEGRAQQLEQALAAAHDSAAGAETIVRVKTRLDAYAEGWVASAREACEATHVHGVSPIEQLDAHTRCLDEGRAALDALVHQLIARPADEVWARAVAASTSLPAVEACAERRPGVNPLSPQLEAELAELASLLSLGAYEDVEHKAAALDARIEDARGRARLLLVRGRANGRLGRADLAQAQLSAAALAAAEAGDDWLLARAQVDLLWIHTSGQERYAAADILVDTARVALRRIKEPPQLRRRLSILHANVLMTRESYTKALAELERGLSAVDVSGGDDLARSTVLERRATVLAALGRVDEAIDDSMFVLEARRQNLGAHHPKVATAQMSLARTLMVAERPQDAEQHLHEVIGAFERSDGPMALAVAEPLMMLAGVALSREDGATGVARAERSLEILTQHGQGDSPHAFSVRNLIGVGYSLQGQHEQAQQILAQTIEARERAGGVDDPAFAFDLHLYAEALGRGGRCDEALPVFERLARVAGEESQLVAFGLGGAGVCRVELGRPGAESQLKKALARHEIVPLEDHERSTFTFALARLRWRQDRHAEARELALAARALAAGPDADSLRDEIEAWLAEHGGGGEQTVKN